MVDDRADRRGEKHRLAKGELGTREDAAYGERDDGRMGVER